MALFFGVVGALLGYNYEKREALAPRVGIGWDAVLCCVNLGFWPMSS